jgi:hypothetical protein
LEGRGFRTKGVDIGMFCIYRYTVYIYIYIDIYIDIYICMYNIYMRAVGTSLASSRTRFMYSSNP